MKAQLITTLIGIALLAGCSTTSINKQEVCAGAAATYAAYLAVINANGVPSRDQIVGALAAAAVLQETCGWKNPNDKVATTTVDGASVTVRLTGAPDRHGVPILVAP